jgi:hypothetical protein
MKVTSKHGAFRALDTPVSVAAPDGSIVTLRCMTVGAIEFNAIVAGMQAVRDKSAAAMIAYAVDSLCDLVTACTGFDDDAGPVAWPADADARKGLLCALGAVAVCEAFNLYVGSVSPTVAQSGKSTPSSGGVRTGAIAVNGTPSAAMQSDAAPVAVA